MSAASGPYPVRARRGPGRGPRLSHNELVARTALLAQSLGLLWHCCTDSRACQGSTGFPDLTIVGPGGIVFIEIKTDDDETSAAQDRWIWTLSQTGMSPVHVYRMKDLLDGTIEKELLDLV